MKDNKRNIENYNKAFRNKLSEDFFLFISYVKSRKIYLAMIALICIVLIGFTVFFTVQDSKNKETYKVALATYNEKKAEYDTITKKYLSEVLFSEFTTQELTNMSRQYYSYSLYVNGQAYKTVSNIINSEGNRIVITFMEKIEKTSLPDDIIALGHYSAIQSQVIVKSNHTNIINEKQEGSIYKVEMIFDNIKVGDILTLQLQEDLANKLGLDGNMIEITTNK